jgi:hypothetical protein
MMTPTIISHWQKTVQTVNPYKRVPSVASIEMAIIDFFSPHYNNFLPLLSVLIKKIFYP